MHTFDENLTVKERIFKCDFSVLPLVRPPFYSIFLSSTFVDTQVERNAILEHVQPRILDICKSQNIEFNLIDLRYRKVLLF